MLAQVSVDDSRCTSATKYGNLLGWHDEDTAWTRDHYGNPVGVLQDQGIHPHSGEQPKQENFGVVIGKR